MSAGSKEQQKAALRARMAALQAQITTLKDAPADPPPSAASQSHAVHQRTAAVAVTAEGGLGSGPRRALDAAKAKAAENRPALPPAASAAPARAAPVSAGGCSTSGRDAGSGAPSSEFKVRSFEEIMAEKRRAREAAAVYGGPCATSAAASEPRPGAKRGAAAAGAPTAPQRAKAPRGNPAGAGVYVPPAARAAAAAPAPALAAKAGAAGVAAAGGSGDVRRIKSLQELLDEKKRAAQQEQQVATGKPAARQQPKQQPAANAKAKASSAEADLTSVLSAQPAPWDPTRRGSRGGSGGVKKAAKKARREQEAAAASAPSTSAPAPASQAQEAVVAAPTSASASVADDMDAELLDFEDDGEEVGDIDFEKEMLDMEALVATS